MVPHPMRIAYATAATVANMVLAVVYLRAGVPVIEQAGNHPGPFSGIPEMMYVIIPVIIGGLQLGILLWLIIAPVQEQRSANQVVR
jgi:TRAP-type C4-dicarboxylate transport system permease small subunit